MGRRGQRGARGRSGRGARTLALLAGTALALTVVVPLVDGPGDRRLAADAEAGGAAAAIVSMINASRSANGTRTLSVATDLTAAAAARAQAMANAGALSHTANLGRKVCCWSWLGENVGYAYSARQAHSLFMDSAPHRANVLKASATEVGVAVVKREGTLWVAEVFRDRAGGGGGGAGSPSTTADPVRSQQATQSSRSQPRRSPATQQVAKVATPQHSARHALRDRLADLRSAWQARVAEHGRPDPLLAALVYANTLARVVSR